MKNIFRLEIVFFIILFLFILNIVPILAGTNIVQNSSLEVDSDNNLIPDNWGTDNWGTKNAEFIYKDTGYQSNHSAYVKITNYKDGDAKWFFEPIKVEPNTTYVFSDRYMSNVKTSIVAMSLDKNGNESYFEIRPTIPKSGVNWRKIQYEFKTLSNTDKISVFHLISRNGWLQIDDVSLSLKNNSSILDNVPNNSVEISSNGSLPDSWIQSSWGENVPIYEYVNEGHDGNKSVKLTMTEYVSGDAKWDYNPQPLTAGKDYQFTAWYKTDTIPHVVVRYLMNNGTEEFFGLSDPEPNGTDWQQYKGVFSVPKTGVKGVSVFFFLTNNGYVEVDDFHVTPYQYQPLNRGIISISFDDGFESNVNTVLPILNKYGFKVTYCYATKYLEEQPDQIPNFLKITNSGHEACSHSVNHTDLTLEPLQVIDDELSKSKQYIENLTGQSVTTFSSPFGSYNSKVIEEIKKYYSAQRTTEEGYNSKNSDPYRLLAQNMQINTSLDQFKLWVNKAKNDKVWLILVYHVVDTGTGLEQFDTKKDDFEKQMQWLSTAGVPVMRVDQALSEIEAQL